MSTSWISNEDEPMYALTITFSFFEIQGALEIGRSP